MNIDLEQLKEFAQATDRARWNTEGFEQTAGTGAFYGGLIMHENGHTIIAQQVMSPHAVFIAAANPAAVLELIERLERAEEAAGLRTVQRDASGNALFIVTSQCLGSFKSDPIPDSIEVTNLQTGETVSFVRAAAAFAAAPPAVAQQAALTDERILQIAMDQETCPVHPWWLKDDVIVGDIRQAVIAFARALLAAQRAG
jgi:hypothetical protein